MVVSRVLNGAKNRSRSDNANDFSLAMNNMEKFDNDDLRRRSKVLKCHYEYR